MKEEFSLKKLIIKILFVIIVLSLIGYLIFLITPKDKIDKNIGNIVDTFNGFKEKEEVTTTIEDKVAEDIKNDKYVWYYADGNKNENILELDNKVLLDKVILRRFINKTTNELYYLIESPHYVRENGYIYQDEIQHTKIKDYNEYVKEEYATISKDETFFKEGERGREVLLTVKDSYTNKKITIFITKSGISTTMGDINED